MCKGNNRDSEEKKKKKEEKERSDVASGHRDPMVTRRNGGEYAMETATERT